MTELQRIALSLLFVLFVMTATVRSDMAKSLMWALAMGVVIGVIINLARML